MEERKFDFSEFIMSIADNIEDMRKEFLKRKNVYNLFVMIPNEWRKDMFLASEVVEKDLAFEAVDPEFFKNHEFLECALIGLFNSNNEKWRYLNKSEINEDYKGDLKTCIAIDYETYNYLNMNDLFVELINKNARFIKKCKNEIILGCDCKDILVEHFFAMHDEYKMREELKKNRLKSKKVVKF